MANAAAPPTPPEMASAMARFMAFAVRVDTRQWETFQQGQQKTPCMPGLPTIFTPNPHPQVATQRKQVNTGVGHIVHSTYPYPLEPKKKKRLYAVDYYSLGELALSSACCFLNFTIMRDMAVCSRACVYPSRKGSGGLGWVVFMVGASMRVRGFLRRCAGRLRVPVGGSL